jgi:hypothetical protein
MINPGFKCNGLSSHHCFLSEFCLHALLPATRFSRRFVLNTPSGNTSTYEICHKPEIAIIHVCLLEYGLSQDPDRMQFLSGTIAGRLRDDCERWLMLYDLAGPELANGARLIDQALCLSRNFDQEV